jgi:hypothetical protein
MATGTSTPPKLPKTGHSIVSVPVMLVIKEPATLNIIEEIEGWFPAEAIIDITKELSNEDVLRHSVIIFLTLPKENPHLGCCCMENERLLSILACEENKPKKEIAIAVLTALKTELAKIA